MQSICTKHEKKIHKCVEEIINTFKKEMFEEPHEDQEPNSAVVTCAQVESILAYAASAGYHQLEHHEPRWEAVIYMHRPGIACGKCGVFFTNRVLEEARRLGVL